jgi:cell division septation protein DedD
LTSHTPDDGFHEIQLNGKQLVFLFMAATVVSVVIFLCGVLVGRGVRAGQVLADEGLDVPIVDQTTATAGAATVAADPRDTPPPTRVDDLKYFERLEKADPAAEDLKQPAPPPAAPPPVSTVPVTARPTPKPAPPPATPAPVPAARPAAASGPAGKAGYVVQLAALNSQGEAETMAKRLTARGYQAYVQAPADGGPSIFRVRVGSYSTRSEAEIVAAKLEKEGQFKPWVAPR